MSGRGDGAVNLAAAREAVRQQERSGRGRPQEGGMGAIFSVFPLIFIPVVIYNVAALLGSSLESSQAVVAQLQGAAFTVPMASQVSWVVTWGDILIFIGLIALFVELLKSTSTGASAIFNHALSMIVFILCLIEFLLFPAFATSVFFMLMVMSLLDVLAGVIVTIVSARRDVEFDKGG